MIATENLEGIVSDLLIVSSIIYPARFLAPGIARHTFLDLPGNTVTLMVRARGYLEPTGSE